MTNNNGNCIVCKLVTFLVALGALNWGLVAFLQTDIVANLFGVMTPLAKVVYGLIGLSGLLKLVSLVKNPCPCCKTGDCKK